MATNDEEDSGRRTLLTSITSPVRAVIGRRGIDDTMETARLLRVLVVDDEPDIRLAMRLSLRHDERFEVVGEAEDGEEAIAKAAQLHPDVILLDIMMPRLDGRSTAPELFREHPRTMIVIISALSADEEAPALLANGAFAYLEKTELGPGLADGLYDLWERFRRGLDGETVWAPNPALRGSIAERELPDDAE